MAPNTEKASEYRVVIAGASYTRPDGAPLVARRGDTIALLPKEADRLKALDAIVDAGEPDPQAGTSSEHAQALESKEEHAAKAKKAAAKDAE